VQSDVQPRAAGLDRDPGHPFSRSLLRLRSGGLPHIFIFHVLVFPPERTVFHMGNQIQLSKEAIKELEQIAQEMGNGIEAIDKDLVAHGFLVSEGARKAVLRSRAEYCEWKTRWMRS
jgi:hypothetical protein